MEDEQIYCVDGLINMDQSMVHLEWLMNGWLLIGLWVNRGVEVERLYAFNNID